MNIFQNYHPLGLGTTRLPILHENDEEGIEKSVQIVCRALELGVDYIDTSHQYAKNMAHAVLKQVFKKVNRDSFGVTIKSRYGQEHNSYDVQKRIETSLEEMGLRKAAFFCVWTIYSYTEFEAIMRKGGIYEGAVEAYKRGLIDHICLSVHALVPDIIRMIDSKAFEGITISFNPFNVNIMLPVLDAAKKYDIGIAVMNPLGGGIIADNPEYFSGLIGNHDENVVSAALRFIKANSGVNILLSGISTIKQLEENIHYIVSYDPEPREERIIRVNNALKKIENFCTGCNYCSGCPVNIPISAILQSVNKLNMIMPSALSQWYNRSDFYLLESIVIFNDLQKYYQYTPETSDNPCINCGMCEKHCTQHLKIRETIDDFYKRSARGNYNIKAWRSRIALLLNNKNYKNVGIYPNTMQADKLIELYEAFFGKPEFKWIFFNSDSRSRSNNNIAPVYGPEDILNLALDVILIVSYKYDNDIYKNIKPICDKINLPIKILYNNEHDIPFIFN
jgi:predicted aldo/keto reductase-like oxidoreductase